MVLECDGRLDHTVISRCEEGTQGDKEEVSGLELVFHRPRFLGKDQHEAMIRAGFTATRIRRSDCFPYRTMPSG